MRERIWFDPPLFRWSRVVVLAAAGISAVLGWIAHERGMWGVPALGPGVVLAPAASAALVPRGAASVPARPATVVAAAVAPPPAVPSRAASAALRPDELDVCGKGVVKVQRGGSDLDLGETPWRARWLAAMRASADVRTRAAGLLLSTSAVEDEPVVEPLVQLAQQSRDPLVYGWALYLCHARNDRRPMNACLMLSHDEWAALAPDRAAPWLYAASDEAGPRRVDPAEAMYRASRAATLGTSAAALPALVLAAQPTGAGPLDRYAMLQGAIGVAHAIAARTPYPTRHCGAVQMVDANRRQQCEALGQLFAQKAETPMDLVVAKSLGERLGWPAERVRAIGEEVSALQWLVTHRGIGDQPASCAGIERLAASVNEAARLGEIGAAREAVRRSGQSMQELAARAQKDGAAAAVRTGWAASAPGS